jgi:hypothetical protein
MTTHVAADVSRRHLFHHNNTPTDVGGYSTTASCPRPAAFPLILALAVVLATCCSAVAADSPISIDSRVDAGTLTINYKGRKLLVYAFATNQFKPYVRELYTLRGDNVLRDAPPDHLHHHGLMYAVWINGINFWEERGAAGIERHHRLPPQLFWFTWAETNSIPLASFTDIIHWLAPTNRTAVDSSAAALLVERRTLTVTVDEPNKEVALRWESQFQVGPKAGKVTLHGPNYVGLGLRLPESFNHVARFQNSEGLPYSGKNTQNVIASRWTSVSGVMDGRDVMLALFHNADSPRFFFTMLDPFAYLAVTQGLDKTPLEYSTGDKFSLSYLLTVYSENKTPQFIRRRGKLWDKQSK